MSTHETRKAELEAKLKKAIDHHTKDPVKREMYMNLFSEIYRLLGEGLYHLHAFHGSIEEYPDRAKTEGELRSFMGHCLGTSKSLIECLFLFEETPPTSCDEQQ